jgi:hypothetical protein
VGCERRLKLGAYDDLPAPARALRSTGLTIFGSVSVRLHLNFQSVSKLREST